VNMESAGARIANIIARLERVQALLESEGWYVKANSVALAIAALSDKPETSEQHIGQAVDHTWTPGL
jgi:histidinol-phosphate/aromatic aminotransferase/cobyric acid decarboxylase-like protein